MSLQKALDGNHSAGAGLGSYSKPCAQKDQRSKALGKLLDIAHSTLAASKDLVAKREISAPSVLPTPWVGNAPQTEDLDASALKTPLSARDSSCCASPNISAYVVADRLDIPHGHILVVPSEPSRRPLHGHLEAELLCRTTLGLLAPWPLPALISVTLLRGPECDGYPFLAEHERQHLLLLRVSEFSREMSVGGWEAARRLRHALATVVGRRGVQTVVFHNLWGCSRSRCKWHDEPLAAARVLSKACADLPLEVRVQVQCQATFEDLQRALTGGHDHAPKDSGQKRNQRKRRRP